MQWRKLNNRKVLQLSHCFHFVFIFVFLHFIWDRVGWGVSRLSRDSQISRSFSSSSSGSIQSFSQPSRETMSLQYALALPLVLLLVGLARNTSLGRRPWGPPQLTPFNTKEQWLDSDLLPSDWASQTFSKGAHSHPAEETYFGHFYPQSHPLGHYPQFMIIGESWT